MISQNLITKVNRKLSRFFKPAHLLIKAGIISCLVIHFSFLFLHQLNDNPISHQYKFELQAYVDPFFSQAWTLFAPNPINTNMSLLVKFRHTEEGQGFSEIEWIDITEPLIEHRKEFFWSPAQRISKFTQSCMSSVNSDHRSILEQIAKSDSLSADPERAKLFYKNNIKSSYGHNSLLQYCKHVAKNYFANTDKTLENIQVKYRILNAKFPRFSQRELDYYDLDNYEFSEITSDYYSLRNIY